MTVSSSTINQFSPAPADLMQVKNNNQDPYRVVPRKATGYLTDMQIRKIGLVALTVILAIGPILAGVFSAGAGALIIGGLFGFMCGSLGGMISWINWPKADYQTPEGAAIIREDLRAKSLQHLQNAYKFSDLAHYGYIKQETADQMEQMYKKMPNYVNHYVDDNRNRFGYYPDSVFELEMSISTNSWVYDQRQKIECDFDRLRRSPGFSL